MPIGTLFNFSDLFNFSCSTHKASLIFFLAGPSQVASSACSSVNQGISGCSDSTSLSSVSGKFNFQFLKCYSPYVESVSTNNGTVDDVITLFGMGFGSDVSLQNILTFFSCKYSSAVTVSLPIYLFTLMWKI